MSSTFLTRLRIGEMLVDAKGVSRLYNPGVTRRASWRSSSSAALVLLAIVVVTTPALNDLVDLIWLKLKIILGIELARWGTRRATTPPRWPRSSWRLRSGS